MKRTLALAAAYLTAAAFLTALAFDLVPTANAQEAPAEEAALPAGGPDVAPVVSFRQVQEVPLANLESIEVDGTVRCAYEEGVLRCTARRDVAVE